MHARTDLALVWGVLIAYAVGVSPRAASAQELVTDLPPTHPFRLGERVGDDLQPTDEFLVANAQPERIGGSKARLTARFIREQEELDQAQALQFHLNASAKGKIFGGLVRAEGRLTVSSDWRQARKSAETSVAYALTYSANDGVDALPRGIRLTGEGRYISKVHYGKLLSVLIRFRSGRVATQDDLVRSVGAAARARGGLPLAGSAEVKVELSVEERQRLERFSEGIECTVEVASLGLVGAEEGLAGLARLTSLPDVLDALERLRAFLEKQPAGDGKQVLGYDTVEARAGARPVVRAFDRYLHAARLLECRDACVELARVRSSPGLQGRADLLIDLFDQALAELNMAKDEDEERAFKFLATGEVRFVDGGQRVKRLQVALPDAAWLASGRLPRLDELVRLGPPNLLRVTLQRVALKEGSQCQGWDLILGVVCKLGVFVGGAEPALLDIVDMSNYHDAPVAANQTVELTGARTATVVVPYDASIELATLHYAFDEKGNMSLRRRDRSKGEVGIRVDDISRFQDGEVKELGIAFMESSSNAYWGSYTVKLELDWTPSRR